MAVEKKEEETTLTKQEKAFLIKALWTALTSPKWTKDDLIDLGKAIFTREALSKMPEKTFEKIYPFLVEIADSLGIQLSKQAEALAETAPKEEPTKKTEPEEPAK